MATMKHRMGDVEPRLIVANQPAPARRPAKRTSYHTSTGQDLGARLDIGPAYDLENEVPERGTDPAEHTRKRTERIVNQAHNRIWDVCGGTAPSGIIRGMHPAPIIKHEPESIQIKLFQVSDYGDEYTLVGSMRAATAEQTLTLQHKALLVAGIAPESIQGIR